METKTSSINFSQETPTFNTPQKDLLLQGKKKESDQKINIKKKTLIIALTVFVFTLISLAMTVIFIPDTFKNYVTDPEEPDRNKSLRRPDAENENDDLAGNSYVDSELEELPLEIFLSEPEEAGEGQSEIEVPGYDPSLHEDKTDLKEPKKGYSGPTPLSGKGTVLLPYVVVDPSDPNWQRYRPSEITMTKNDPGDLLTVSWKDPDIDPKPIQWIVGIAPNSFDAVQHYVRWSEVPEPEWLNWQYLDSRDKSYASQEKVLTVASAKVEVSPTASQAYMVIVVKINVDETYIDLLYSDVSNLAFQKTI